ncbi:hypothetical protein K1719_035727 [Acacia pycnantha]|nr:hypothetical protein K1719_035727 [Acacia pycnantha]
MVAGSRRKRHKSAYIWNTPLVAPNDDVGLNGMVINVTSLLARIVTNPFGNGFFQGPKEVPLENGFRLHCGKGAYPSYSSNLLEDTVTGASFNSNS